MTEEFEVGQQIRLDGYTYSVERLLRGGMGLVLLCSRTQASFSYLYREKTAVKVFFPAQDARQIRRELQLWQRVSSPHIVPLLAIGHVNDWLCAMMPWYLDGEVNFHALRENGGRIATKTLLLQMCDALESAWSQKILHLDIKPSNILRSGDSFFLADWGIAKLSSSRGIKKDPTTGGTIPYMAPERFLGDPDSIQMDIYALGMSTFELITGALPFQETSVDSLVQAIVSGVVTRRIDSGTISMPIGWRKFISRSCAFEKSQRPKDYAQLRPLIAVLET